jgi:uncharacterized protein (DUF1697 family)
MKTYIALFRGINVGGQTSLPMKEVSAVLEALGGQNVRTYIQSGNAVFQSGERSVSRLAGNIRAQIQQRRGFAPHVMLLTLAELNKAIANNPFPDATAQPATLHVGFLAAVPNRPDLEALGLLKSPSERFHLHEKVFYLHAPDGVGRSRLAASAERLLGVPLTDRNWRTVCRIREIAGG